MLKFAAFEVTAAVLVPRDATPEGLRAIAKRHEFDYDVRPGFLYVRSRAISSRTNDNFDEFPAEEIEKGWRTFIGKPVFVNHVNDNHKRARGVIIDAALHRHTLSDGSPDVWCEVLMEVDAIRFPKLAKAIVEGRVDRTSMGCDVAYSVCSMCGNKATTPAEYCNHIPRLKGKKVLRRNAATGTQEEHLIRETCFGLAFFENSLLVEEPADPTAFFTGVDDRGLQMAASKTASVQKAAQWCFNRSQASGDPIVHPAGHPAKRPLDVGDHVLYDSGHSARIQAITPNLLILEGHHTPVHRGPVEGDFSKSIWSSDSVDEAGHDVPRASEAEKAFLDSNPTGPTKYSLLQHFAAWHPTGKFCTEDSDEPGWCTFHHLSHRAPEGDDAVCNCGEKDLPAQHSHGQHMAWEMSLPCQGCTDYSDPHSSAEHFQRHDKRGLDPWGRPIMQPYDGHGAWNCNNYDCAEHPQEMYQEGHGPVGMPGWMKHDTDPDRDVAREVGKAFHEQGLTEDGRYLLDQQHQGPTKYSSTTAGHADDYSEAEAIQDGWEHRKREGYPLSEVQCMTSHQYKPGRMIPGHGPWSGEGRCTSCGYCAGDQADAEDWARESIGEHGMEDADWLLSQNHTGPTKYSSIAPGRAHWCNDCGQVEGMRENWASTKACSRCGSRNLGNPEDKPPTWRDQVDGIHGLADQINGLGGEHGEWLLSQQHTGPTKFSLLQFFAEVIPFKPRPVERKTGTEPHLHDGDPDGPCAQCGWGANLYHHDPKRVAYWHSDQRLADEAQQKARWDQEARGYGSLDPSIVRDMVESGRLHTCAHPAHRSPFESIWTENPYATPATHLGGGGHPVCEEHRGAFDHLRPAAEILRRDDAAQAAGKSPEERYEDHLADDRRRTRMRLVEGSLPQSVASQDPGTHLHLGDDDQPCANCGEPSAEHPHLHTGQWARCSTCHKDMSHWKHEKGLVEHLDDMRHRPPSDGTTTHLFGGPLAQPYLSHDEEGLADQLKDLGGEDGQWLLDQGEPGPTKYSLLRFFAMYGETDWDKHYDALPEEIHRGLFAPESHQAFGAPASDDEIAHMLLAAHQEEQFRHERDRDHLFGTHWTTDEHVARAFAREHEEGYRSGEYDHHEDPEEYSQAVPVVFHAERPALHEIEHDPRRLDWQNVDSLDSGEKEVPIGHGQPVRIKGVSWRTHAHHPYGDEHGEIWNRHDFDEPVTLRAHDNDSPSDENEWNTPQTKQSSLLQHFAVDRSTDPLSTSECVSRLDNPTYCLWHKADHLEPNGEPRGDVDGYGRPVSFSEPPRCDYCDGFHDSLHHYSITEGDNGSREDDSVLDDFPEDDPGGPTHPHQASGFGTGDADRWVTCDQGHRHWGAAGAAGLLIRHTDDRGNRSYLLQHRAPWVDHGDTWSSPAGALQHGEDSLEGAKREAVEELGGIPHGLRHVGSYEDDHGGWKFTTHVMESPSKWGSSGGEDADHETGEGGVQWVPEEQVNDLDLHPGFAKTWPKVKGIGVRKQGSASDGEEPEKRETHCPECGEEYAPDVVSHIHLDEESKAAYRAMWEAAEMRSQMAQHAHERTVDLNDPHDLRSHLMEAHDYDENDFWRASHDDDHPALEPHDGYYDDDRPLKASEVRRMHDWEHGHGIKNEHPHYDGGMPGHFLGDSHFHTAVRKTAALRPTCKTCGEDIKVNPNTTRRDGSPIPNDGWYHHDSFKRDHLARPHDDRSADDQRASDRAAMDQARMQVRERMHWQFRELEMGHEGSRTARSEARTHQVRVKVRHRSTGRYTGTHGGRNGDGMPWPFRVCDQHLAEVQGDIARHNIAETSHPYTYEVESAPGEGSCDACSTGSVNSAFATRRTAVGREGLEKHRVKAEEVQIGDYLDSSGKVRVHNTHTRKEQVTLAWKLRGSKAPGVRFHNVGETVSVWRKGGGAVKEASTQEPEKLPGGFLNVESNPQDYWSKPDGKAPYEPDLAHHGIAEHQEGHGPWYVTRHPETRAYQVVDSQNRLARSFKDPGTAKYELHNHHDERRAYHIATQANQDHGHIPRWIDREGNEVEHTGLGDTVGQMGQGAVLPGTEHATRNGEVDGPVDKQHVQFHYPAPPWEHSTEDPKVTEYKRRAEENPAPKVYPQKTVLHSSSREHGSTYRTIRHGEPGYDQPGAFHDPSPDEEWHGPYRVIQHPETGKFHVVDNQDRVTSYGGRDGMGEQHHAEFMRDYADGRQASKERAKRMADGLWEGVAQVFDPGSTPESRRTDRYGDRLNRLMHRYQGGDHHPLHPGRFGWDDEEEEGDQEGQPYYEVEHTGGSGFTARDYDGPNVHIYHKATPDEAHDLIDEGDPAQRNESIRTKHPSYGHDELHQTLDNWVRGRPHDPRYPDDTDPSTGRGYSPAKHVADNDPRIKRWQRRNGYQA